MSTAPLCLPEAARWGFRHLIGQRAELRDLMVLDGLVDPATGLLMGEEAEEVARDHKISREELDWVAYESHMRAWRAAENKWFEELAPVEGEFGVRLDRDEGIRPDTTLEKLAKLKPVFRPDGVLTAGNSSQLSDGAAMLLLASEERARSWG